MEEAHNSFSVNDVLTSYNNENKEQRDIKLDEIVGCATNFRRYDWYVRHPPFPSTFDDMKAITAPSTQGIIALAAIVMD